MLGIIALLTHQHFCFWLFWKRFPLFNQTRKELYSVYFMHTHSYDLCLLQNRVVLLAWTVRSCLLQSHSIHFVYPTIGLRNSCVCSKWAQRRRMREKSLTWIYSKHVFRAVYYFITAISLEMGEWMRRETVTSNPPRSRTILWMGSWLFRFAFQSEWRMWI